MSDQHLTARDVAAYLDGAATANERARIEAHLVTCADCRAEVSEAGQIIATLPRARTFRRRATIVAAGIAAMLLVFVWPHTDRRSSNDQHREAPVTTTVSPVILAPTGVVESARVFTWSSVPHADRYELRVFDADGGVVWETQTTDTTVAAPQTIALRTGSTYYWKVEARTGIDRSASTELVEFSVRSPPGR